MPKNTKSTATKVVSKVATKATSKPATKSGTKAVTKAVAKVAGVQSHSAVTITAEPGRIIIESVATRPSLDEMLARFDPLRHGGEVMAFPPVGKEVL